MNLPTRMIKMDGGTQPRSQLNGEVITEYAEAMKAGVTFPDVIVFYDGSVYWLSDGFHRVNAARETGLETVNADVRQGDKRDAVLFSVGANANHGLRRNREDKRRSIRRLCDDSEWQSRSVNWMARICKVSNHLVAAVIEEEYPTLRDRDFVTTISGKKFPAEKQSSKNLIGKQQLDSPPDKSNAYFGLDTEALSPAQQKALKGETLSPEESEQLNQELGYLSEDDLTPEELAAIEQEAKRLAQKHKALAPQPYRPTQGQEQDLKEPPSNGSPQAITPELPDHSERAFLEDEEKIVVELMITLHMTQDDLDDPDLAMYLDRWLTHGYYTHGGYVVFPGGISLQDTRIEKVSDLLSTD